MQSGFVIEQESAHRHRAAQQGGSSPGASLSRRCRRPVAFSLIAFKGSGTHSILKMIHKE
jgi:hypothetical protein